jgi:hypothetical protein
MSQPYQEGQRRSNRIAGIPPQTPTQITTNADNRHFPRLDQTQTNAGSQSQSDLSYSQSTPPKVIPQSINHYEPVVHGQNLNDPTIPLPVNSNHSNYGTQQFPSVQGTTLYNPGQTPPVYTHYPSNTIPPFMSQILPNHQEFPPTAIPPPMPVPRHTEPIASNIHQYPQVTPSSNHLHHHSSHHYTPADVHIQQLRNEYHEQLRALENRFDQKMRDNTHLKTHIFM